MASPRFRRGIGFAALGALVLILSVPTVASAQQSAAAISPPKCGGATHCYVTAQQSWSTPTAHGMGGYFTEPDVMPGVQDGDYSIGQLALISITKNSQKAIEFGWIVAPGLYHDHYPHLFITLRDNPANGTCVLGIPNQIDPCPAGTYIPFSDVHQPGTAVGFPIGHGNATPVLYHVGYFAPDNSWWIQYDKAWIGKIPGTHWTSTFAKANYAQWFGEIAFAPGHNCTPMGDDIYGTLPGSASVTGMFYEQVVGGQSKLYPASAHLSTVSDFRYWWSDKAGKKTFNSFHYGGPIFGPNGC